ncbi:MAG: hypothetical protein RBT11_19705 [Desulfobacterales bacterium]|nr:hypothetical protein [Desulfobacterales bacterium]
MKYKVICTQMVEELTDGDDQADLPAGPFGVNSVREYFFDADDEEDALDQFHESVPVGCLEDFSFLATPVVF